MLGSWQLEMSLQITLAVVPVAVYFLILGLLNSQKHPQLLTGRIDFALLMASFSPLCAVPVLAWMGARPLTVVIVASAVAGTILLLAPRKQQAWVAYNVSIHEALRSVEWALRHAGIDFDRQGQRLVLDNGAVLRLSAFPLLRNVSLTVSGATESTRSALCRFEASLAHQMGGIDVVASPMAVSFVLISTAMIVAPLVLLADRMPEMVRIITDMMG